MRRRLAEAGLAASRGRGGEKRERGGYLGCVAQGSCEEAGRLKLRVESWARATRETEMCQGKFALSSDRREGRVTSGMGEASKRGMNILLERKCEAKYAQDITLHVRVAFGDNFHISLLHVEFSVDRENVLG